MVAVFGGSPASAQSPTGCELINDNVLSVCATSIATVAPTAVDGQIHSTGFGGGAFANGSVATALEDDSNAIGSNGTALGGSSNAIGDFATATGLDSASPRPAPIDRNGVLILIRSALLALDDANKTGNYSVLRDLGAPGFGEANSDAQLAEIFATQRKDNLDLSGVAVLEPQLTLVPQIEANGIMRMAGFIPSVPTRVDFELLYAAVNRQWRLMGIAVSLGQTAPVSSASPAAEQPRPYRPEPKAKHKTKPVMRIAPHSRRSKR